MFACSNDGRQHLNNDVLFVTSRSGVEGQQPRGAALRRGPGEDAGGQGQQEAGEKDQGVDDAARGREEACGSVQGAE